MATSRLDELRLVDPVLTTIAQGYENSAFVWDKLFPVVEVDKMKGKIVQFGKEAFSVKDTLRGLRASSNRIPPSNIELIDYELAEEDIEVALDYLEEEESADFLRYEEKIAKELSDMLNLKKEKYAGDFAQDSANYPEGGWREIDPTEAFDDYASGIDPIITMRGAATRMRERLAVYPNIAIIGDAAYQSLMNNPQIIARYSKNSLAVGSPSIIASMLDLEKVYVATSVYCDEATGAFMDIWGDNVVLAYVDSTPKDRRSRFNPGFGYTLRRRGKPEIDTYYENGGKIKVVRNTDTFAMKVTCAEALYLLKNVNQAV